jgi:hypothetical protein
LAVGVGLVCALLSALGTNLAFLFKHRGAVAAPDVDMRHPLRCTWPRAEETLGEHRQEDEASREHRLADRDRGERELPPHRSRSTDDGPARSSRR